MILRHRHGRLTLRREDGRIICERVKVADTWFRRLRGLLFRSSVPSDQGVVLRPSFSIHTAFLRFPIDAVFLDQDLTVLRIAASVPPFRTASCRGAREVVELRAGECERRGLAVGDRVAWASTPAPDSAAMTAVPTVPTPSPPPTRPVCVVASGDERFVKLSRFLLENEGVDVTRAVRPSALVGELESSDAFDLVVVDVDEGHSAGLAAANAARALLPDAEVFLVGAPEVVAHAMAGVRIYDKWSETTELIAAVTGAVAGARQVDAASPLTEPD